MMSAVSCKADIDLFIGGHSSEVAKHTLSLACDSLAVNCRSLRLRVCRLHCITVSARFVMSQHDKLC